jgi:competence protein ComEC
LITNFYPYKSKYNINDNLIRGYIHNYIIDGDKLTIELKGKENIVASYYFKTEEEKNSFILSLGDNIEIKGKLTIPQGRTVFNLYSYKNYLYHKRVYYLIQVESIKLIKNNNKLQYAIKNWVINTIEKRKYSSNYVRAFILGDTDYINDKVNSSYQFNGVSHLFAISGSNISFLAIIILFILKKCKIDELKRYIIVILFLLFYMFLTDYSGSVLRATIFFIFLSFNRIYYFHVKIINILLLTIFTLLVANPFLIYDIGFQFSVVICLYLILFQSLIIKYKHFIMKTFIVSFIAFLGSIPISIYNFYQINVLSPIINIIFVPLVSFILFPLSLITFIFPIFDSILFFFIKIMEILSTKQDESLQNKSIDELKAMLEELEN